MDAYRLRSGQRLTYEALAERTGLSTETLQSLAARPGYNARLSTIEAICRALDCSPGEILELVEEGDEDGVGRGDLSSGAAP